MATRREFLRLAASAGAVAALPGLLRAQGDAAYGGFQMGIQTYSLRAFDLDKCLEIVKDLGLKHLQFYSGKQAKITDDAAAIDALKKKLADAGLKVLSWGVEGFGKDAAANKKKFEFAKAMGFNVFTANPSPDSFENLAALTKEYGVKIAIHNHGPEDKTYGKLDQIQKAIEKWPVEIGVCVDTGHTLRAGEDPVKWIQALGPRVHDVHLKDASAPQVYNVLGQGKLDVLGTLKALKDIKFTGLLALEYELNEKNPVDDIKRCLEVAREACKKL
ncbi:MAG TPA: sugar phosphate isomerase/epimerase [Planctomycetota bacterium]